MFLRWNDKTRLYKSIGFIEWNEEKRVLLIATLWSDALCYRFQYLIVGLGRGLHEKLGKRKVEKLGRPEAVRLFQRFAVPEFQKVWPMGERVALSFPLSFPRRTPKIDSFHQDSMKKKTR